VSVNPTGEVYRWFFDRKCDLWNRDGQTTRCSILDVQRANYRRIPKQAAVYYPEALFGNPSCSIIFLGINPGQTAIKPNESERQRIAGQENEASELEECPNSIRHQGMELETYVQYHVQYNLKHPKEKVLAGAGRILQQTWECSASTALAKLTFMNVAHCKCPNYGASFSEMAAPQHSFWNACGVQTLKVISLLRPKAVVCLGAPVQWWLAYVDKATEPAFYEPWHLNRDATKKCWGQTMVLANSATGVQIPCLMAYHPTQGAGKFNSAHVKTIAAALRGILFMPHGIPCRVS